jgi:hypothetical protein
MAKDRNTMAKRQREVDKRRKADEKRDKRNRRKTEPGDSDEPMLELTDGEANVLAVFRKYLMTPGQMLCLSNTDIDSMKLVLESLTSAGLLVPEEFKGGYSLTPSGFRAMNELA